jgi:hypothetical protein
MDQTCKNVVLKLTTGEHLEDGEKAHLATCERCMAEVVKQFDEAATGQRHGPGVNTGETNGGFSRARPEAKKALEQGRRVFEREFGISLPKT